VTILEVARTLQKLISEGKLARPARTIRFIFPPEIEGTMALLIGKAAGWDEYATWGENRTTTDPLQLPGGASLTKRIKAVVHMDMVGGGPETKAVFHVTRGPMSLPSFVHDVAWAFAEFVNEESYKFAATGEAKYPMVAPEGGKDPLRAEYSAYTMGSDHDVYQDSSFGIPAIYLNDWPDRYIHTNFDTAANIDPTKLKRAAFIGAASGYFLAGITNAEAWQALQPIRDEGLARNIYTRSRMRTLEGREICVLLRALSLYANSAEASYYGFSDSHITGFRQGAPNCEDRWADFVLARGLYKRAGQPKGPLAVFGYDYFAEHAKAAGVATPKLLSYEGLWGGGEEYAYEVLNFADGKRNAQEIRDAVSAEYGPVPLEMVVEYLKALEKIGVVEEVK
jgi:hypothetical protein